MTARKVDWFIANRDVANEAAFKKAEEWFANLPVGARLEVVFDAYYNNCLLGKRKRKEVMTR